MRMLRGRSNCYAASARLVRNPCVIMTGMGLKQALPAFPVKTLAPGSTSFAPGPRHAYAQQLYPSSPHGRKAHRARRSGMHGLGIAVSTPRDTLAPVTRAISNVFTSQPLGPHAAPQPVGPFRSPITFNPVQTSPTPTSGATSTTTATQGSSPVPVGYSTNEIYVNPADGSWWEYSPSTSTWVSVGTPYNTAAIAAASTSSSGSGGTAATVGAAVATGNSIVASDGSVWQYSSASNSWVEISGAGSATPAAGAPPPSYFTAAATSAITPATVGSTSVTASDGSVWQYNSSTGTWTQTEAAGSATPGANAPTPAQLSASGSVSDYQSVLNWL